MVAWLEDAKTGAKISDEVSVVELADNFFSGVDRFGELIVRDLICTGGNRRRRRPGPCPGKSRGLEASAAS